MGIVLSILVIMLALCFAAEAKDLPLGKRTYQILPPGVSATIKMPMTWNIPIRDPNDKSKTTVVQIPVTNILAWNPLTETAVIASVHKAGAIKDAIDTAVTAGTLPVDVKTTV